MSLIEAVQTCFRKYVVYRGRAIQSEFWYFVLALLLAQIFATILNSAIFGPEITQQISVKIDAQGNQSQSVVTRSAHHGGYIGSLISLITIVPLVSVAVRRLHDRGMSGFWLLMPLAAMGIIYALLNVTGSNMPIDTSGVPEGVDMPESLHVPAGWAIASNFVVGIGSIIALLVFLARAGQAEANRFGLPPLAQSEET